MARPEAKKGGAFEKIKDSIKSVLESTLVAQLKEGAKFLVEELVHKGQDIVYQTEKKIVDSLVAAVILLVGIVMIILAVTFFLTDFFRLERYWSFLIVGLVLIIAAILFKKRIEKTKYYSFGGR